MVAFTIIATHLLSNKKNSCSFIIESLKLQLNYNQKIEKTS
ncbi:hypothetical protein SAMN03080601_03243 [Alkalitalea saponilacus]|uniref:Uncharacterized protein n=1 Tax=Alkalitalea saponilacus TaxID=889453 RepID=A0A1T5HTE3_9BACT|nr:hypothetical protein SAMN03080601_03243 [Alkalitalea saponilacus]